jgi:predicted nuclease of predicted toxin-antitoxin system
MKLLFDQNISYRVLKKLPIEFSNSRHVSELSLTNSEDERIWLFAKKEEFTIVTFDSDFYDFSIINGCPPKIIWLKTGNLTSPEIIDLLIKHSKTINDFIFQENLKQIACLKIY